MAKTIREAEQGDVFAHAVTGAVISIAMRISDIELLTVQLNNAAGQRKGWVSCLYVTARDWTFVRNAQERAS